MNAQHSLTFFHSPNTRSSGAFVLLEELGVSYDLHVLDQKKAQQLSPEYLAINPMGKVPAIRHGDALVTEQAAVYMYLADLFPEKGLAPALNSPLRGPYLRWMVFYGSSFEPALVDRALKREPGPRSVVPYGTYDLVINTLVDQLSKGPYILGETFSAADVLWGMALRWTTGFKLVPELPEIVSYVQRISSRPSIARVEARDAELAAKH